MGIMPSPPIPTGCHATANHCWYTSIERGVINVFKGLSWDYKSSSPCQFDKKIIVNNLVSYNRWGSAAPAIAVN